MLPAFIAAAVYAGRLAPPARDSAIALVVSDLCGWGCVSPEQFVSISAQDSVLLSLRYFFYEIYVCDMNVLWMCCVLHAVCLVVDKVYLMCPQHHKAQIHAFTTSHIILFPALRSGLHGYPCCSYGVCTIVVLHEVV